MKYVHVHEKEIWGLIEPHIHCNDVSAGNSFLKNYMYTSSAHFIVNPVKKSLLGHPWTTVCLL